MAGVLKHHQTPFEPLDQVRVGAAAGSAALFGATEGLDRAIWEPADPSYGKGIVLEELEQ
ncbi:hypothetical protein [Streptomyces sp. NPDC023327]|uniref:hypothetical protein n=1 Tax=Streptomyces sp. NPDC023327 TaxID=3157088 RepID=UPI0033E3944F